MDTVKSEELGIEAVENGRGINTWERYSRRGDVERGDSRADAIIWYFVDSI